ncbi:MAG: amidohydrolase [Promethearchaeota archaeon]
MNLLARPIVIENGTLIDGTGRPAIQNSVVVISGSKIIDVGLTDGINIPKDAKVINAKGKTVLPGFIDSHAHFILLGLKVLTELNLSMTKSISEVMEMIKTKVTELPKGTWLKGHGWDESNWIEKRYPTKKDLDPVSPDHPVVLTPFYWHTITVNSKALELAKIDVDGQTPDPLGGKIDRAPTGEATGVLKEEAMKLIDKAQPPLTEELAMRAIEKACEIVLQWGCTSIHELASTSSDLATYQAAFERGLLKVRAYVLPATRYIENLLDGLNTLGIRTSFGNEFVKLGSVKIWFDGAMGSHTAVFSEPYADDPTTSGLYTISPEQLNMTVMRAHKLGMQVAIHAIGDKAIEEALDAIELALKDEPRKDHRHRIEHCEVIKEDQVQRMKRLGVIAAVQPNFVGEWEHPGGMYEQRLGVERLKLCNPFRSLLDEGIIVTFGTDCGYCPPFPFNPLYGIWSAVCHPIAKHSIKLEEAVKCYTLNGAYTSFEEDMKGSIEPGKLADIAILSEDLTAIPAERIKDVKVDLTMVGGKIQWQA